MKNIRKILSGAMALCLMGSMAVIPEVSMTANAETTVAEWKEVYANFLMQYAEKHDNVRWMPIYIDNDNIPELAIKMGNGLSQGVMIVTYYDGQAIALPAENSGFGSLGMFSYGRRKNIFLSPGSRDTAINTFYSIENGSLVEQYKTTEYDSQYETENIDSYLNDRWFVINDYTINKYIYGRTNDGLMWDFDNNYTFVLSGEGDMDDYIYEYYLTIPWEFIYKDIKQIIIEEGVTSIGACAFLDCESLKSVTILNPECEIVSISNGLNENCECCFYGYENSTAQAYAEKYGYNFESLGEYTALPLGNVNGDNLIDAVDSSVILAEYSLLSTESTPTFTYAQKKSADVNGDGLIDAVDATLVLSYYAEISTGNEITLQEFIAENAQ